MTSLEVGSALLYSSLVPWRGAFNVRIVKSTVS